jgi:hypothetical protein
MRVGFGTVQRPYRPSNYVRIKGVKNFYTKSIGWVDIDPEIVAACKIFCQKGHITVSSCAAHITSSEKQYEDGRVVYSGYVSFLKGFPLPKALPEHMRFERGNICWTISTQAQLNRVHANLLKLAKSVAAAAK